MESSPTTGCKKSLRNFLEEERRSSAAVPYLPPRKSSFGNIIEPDDHSQLSSARTSCVSASSFPLIRTAICPDSPWIRSSPIGCGTTLQPPTYHCLASLHRSEGSIFCLTIAKNFVITGSSSSRIHAWKQTDSADMDCVDSKTGQIRAIIAGGNLLVSAHGDFRVRLWDVSSSADKFRPKKMMTLPRKRPFFIKKKIDTHKDHISCLAINNVDMLVYTGSWDQTVKVWSITKKRCVDSFLAHDSQINAIVINQEDGCVFTCSSDGTVKIWRRVSKESSHILTVTLKFQPSPINALALSNYSSCFLYSGSSDGLINFWTKEGSSGRYNHGGFLQGHHFSVLCLVAVQDMILSGSEDATIRVWRREEGSSLHSCLVVVDGHHGPVKCLAAVLEGNEMVKALLVYSASLDQTVKVWRVRICPDERSLKGRKSQGESEQCKMSPVLSPSWVEKKIQGSDY